MVAKLNGFDFTELYNYHYYNVYVIKMNDRNDRARRGGHDLSGGQFMMGSLQIPPAWSPADHASYSFRSWVRDIGAWAIATDLPAEQQGAAVILRLGGTARAMCAEIEPQIVTNGTYDDVDGVLVPITGLEFIVRGLSRKYVPLAAANSVKAISDMMTFGHRGGENVDDVLSRFDILKQRVRNAAGLDPGPSGFAWMLLIGMRIPTDEWLTLLIPFQGVLPGTETS